MTPQHRIQAPHVQTLQLGDAPILTKTAPDSGFMDLLKTCCGCPYGTSWHGKYGGRRHKRALLWSIEPFGPFGLSIHLVVVGVKPGHVGGGAVLHIQVHMAGRQAHTHSLLKVPLIVCRRHLNFWVWVGNQCVATLHALDHERHQAPHAVAVRSVGPHTQIPKRPSRNACQRGPAGLLHLNVGVSCPPPIDSRQLPNNLTIHLKSSLTEGRTTGQKMNHPSEGVTAIHHTARAHDHLRLCDGKRIQSSRILEVARTVDGVVHAYAINNQQHPIGFKATQNGADPALLAHLQMNLSRVLEKVPSGFHGDDWRFHRHSVQMGYAGHRQRSRHFSIGLNHDFLNFKCGRHQLDVEHRLRTGDNSQHLVTHGLDAQCVACAPHRQRHLPLGIGDRSLTSVGVEDGREGNRCAIALNHQLRWSDARRC